MRKVVALSVCVLVMSGCGIMAANRAQAERWKRIEEQRQFERELAERDAAYRANVAKLDEGQTVEQVEALIGPAKNSELIDGKRQWNYYAGGFPMILTYSKENRLTGWRVNQAALDRIQRAQGASELIEAQENEGRLNRRHDAIQNYLYQKK